MWYCTFVGQYRIGYATSPDGFVWTRHDDGNWKGPEGSAWDGDEMAYPHVFRHGARLWMLYSGAGFGREGLGLAVADVDQVPL